MNFNVHKFRADRTGEEHQGTENRVCNQHGDVRPKFGRSGAIGHEQKVGDRPESSAKLHQQSGQGDKNRGNIGSGRRWIRGVLATVLHSVSGHPLHGTGTTGRSHESLDLARYVYLYINFHEIANSWKCCKHCRRILLHFGNCETRHYFVLWRFSEFASGSVGGKLNSIAVGNYLLIKVLSLQVGEIMEIRERMIFETLNQKLIRLARRYFECLCVFPCFSRRKR